MKIIGLTGGIATGKSTVADKILQQGLVLVDCDKIAKQVVRKGNWGHRRVVAIFGEDVLLPNGELDRPKLGHIVFNNTDLRKKLNKATHWPVFVELGKQILVNWLLCKSSLVIDMPLLFETGFQSKCNFTILVTCSEATQLKRLMKRDSSTEEQALSRIKSQMPQSEKIKLADEIIDNNGSQSATRQQVKNVLDKRLGFSFWHSVLLSPIGVVAIISSVFYGLKSSRGLSL